MIETGCEKFRTWTPQSNKSFDEIASEYGYVKENKYENIYKYINSNLYIVEYN